MSYSQKYTLVASLEPVSIGDEFSMAHWPLHVTLADAFAIDLPHKDVRTQIKAVLKKHFVFETTIKGNATLGSNQAMLLENNARLQHLHCSIVAMLEANHATFNSPQFTRSGFLPHCANQSTTRLRPGDKISLGVIGLVDMFPRGDWQSRKVIEIFRLPES